MRVVIIQSRDSDVDLVERIRAAVEGSVEPLEIEGRTVCFFYQIPEAVDPDADMNIALLFPRRVYGAIAAEVYRVLVERRARVFFEWYENLPAAEDAIVDEIVRLISG
ncbi:TPA: hypothetical protein EYP13_04005 [Candidatus Micrarchaeota archaeon]|nr:hypothetical protein [Candidatus Micrarchaeota archaeon]